jgi:hypothetical protein
MGVFKYWITLLVLGVAMYSVSQLQYGHSEQDGTSSSMEVPANMLVYAKEDVKKTYYSTALEHVDNAIRTMREAEEVLDPEANAYIEMAINDLNKIKRELVSGFIFEDDVNLTFARALNSLAYAYMRVSEDALAEDKQTEALGALTVAVMQLDYSMLFATGQLFEKESIIMASLAAMLEDETLEIGQLHPLTEDLKVLVTSQSEASE